MYQQCIGPYAAMPHSGAVFSVGQEMRLGTPRPGDTPLPCLRSAARVTAIEPGFEQDNRRDSDAMLTVGDSDQMQMGGFTHHVCEDYDNSRGKRPPMASAASIKDPQPFGDRKGIMFRGSGLAVGMTLAIQRGYP